MFGLSEFAVEISRGKRPMPDRFRTWWRRIVPVAWRDRLWQWRDERYWLARWAARAFARCPDDQARFNLANDLLVPGFPELVYTEARRSWTKDAEFLTWYKQQTDGANLHSVDRKYFLRELLQLVRDLPGDTAECGVYRGASSWLICNFFRESQKTHFGFDSFEGISPPQAVDGAYWKAGDLTTSIASAQNLLVPFRAELLAGWIPTRFAEVADRQFCFVHLDVDVYEPTRDSLEFFYPRLVPGGVIVCDDYGFESCPGAKRAMDDHRVQHRDKFLNCTTGQGVIIKR